MTPERWQQVERLYQAALAREAASRSAYLDEACAGDPDLRQEVDSLLAAQVQGDVLFETPAIEVVARRLADQAPRFEPGRQLGLYRLVSKLGAGGMGEVYRARDTKLGRDVALKILPALFAHDADRLARFRREAQVLASLNHPNIAAIYGLEEADGVRALVLELVEGPTLAEKLAEVSSLKSQVSGLPIPPSLGEARQAAGVGPRGIPIDEALPIARQIADALEAAHERGVIHRDLKPSNIKVRTDGIVKVLDFGLAKAFEVAGIVCEGSTSVASMGTESPTLSVAATRDGVILGTAAYMAPEQAKGKPVDKRADIWAFGCVLYEMLTGCRAFEGEDVSDTLAFVITKDPDWRALPPTTPPAIQRLLRRSLEKDRKRRLPDIADARIEIDEALTASPSEPAPAAPLTMAQPVSRGRPVATYAAVALVASAVTATGIWLTMRPSLPQVTRLTIAPSSAAALTVGGSARDLAIAPDGRHVVYVGSNGARLFVRAMDQLEATPLTGLSAPRHPFFSPDGQWVGFFDTGSVLKKVAITGGPTVVMASRLSEGFRGATWGPDDTIIFATADVGSGLQRVSAAGGESTVLTRPNRERGESDHLWPEFLPGGQAVLFTIAPLGSPIRMDSAQVAVLDLRTGTQKILVRGGSHAQYVPSGHLVYGVAGTLRAIVFDLDRLEAVGAPIPVLPEVTMTGNGAAGFAVARDGTLVYVPGDAAVRRAARTLVWVDRQGREEPINAPARQYTYPRISPDGTRVALDVRDQQNDIWIWHLARGTLTRFTLDPAEDQYPVWTPDGRRLLFRSARSGQSNLFWQAADGTGAVERLTQSENPQWAYAMTRDGTRLVFREDNPKTGRDLMALTLDKQRQAHPLVRTTFAEFNGEISPDGRWLAYQSSESGQNEIFVQPFPNVGEGRWQISTGGGAEPLWARGGQELFYLAPTGALMSIRIERAQTFAFGTPTKLFEGRYFLVDPVAEGRKYDVSPDGKHFLMIKPGGAVEQTAPPANIIVVQNWLEELKRLVPTK